MKGISDVPGIEGKLTPRRAISESVRTRVRPIFMTTLTTILGLLPLVVMPGAGSELYRGLGAVVLGGLLVSTIFTLILVPLLMNLVIDARAAVVRFLTRAQRSPAGASVTLQPTRSHGA